MASNAFESFIHPLLHFTLFKINLHSHLYLSRNRCHGNTGGRLNPAYDVSNTNESLQKGKLAPHTDSSARISYGGSRGGSSPCCCRPGRHHSSGLQGTLIFLSSQTRKELQTERLKLCNELGEVCPQSRPQH